MTTNAALMARLGDNRPTLLEAAAELRRNQVLVDEATDFAHATRRHARTR
jgi:uncharacterized protein (UPF0276 family)